MPVEQKNLEQLSQLRIDGFYHNAASVEKHPKRLQRGLDNPAIRGIEIDVISYKGDLVAAHDARGFDAFRRKNPEKARLQRLEFVVARCAKQGLALNFDLKFPNHQSLRHRFEDIVLAMPTDIRVHISGKDWQLLARMHDMARPHTTMFTVDGQWGRMWEDYSRRIVSRVTSDQDRQVGVSIKHKLVKPRIIEELNQHDQYSLVFSVDDAPSVIRFANMGVSGITSNEENILSALGK